MSFTNLLVRDVTILTAPPVDTRYGDTTILDWDNATETEVKGWLGRFDENEQLSATRDADVGNSVLRLPAGTAITSANRVVIDGETFEVDGSPHRAWTPRGEHHIRVPLRSVSG